jgi:hypothetical protein
LFKGMTFDDQFDLTGQDDIELKFKHWLYGDLRNKLALAEQTGWPAWL